MGNFLFQAACAIAYARKHGLEFTVPNETDNPKGNPIYLQHLVNPNYNPRLTQVKLTENNLYHQPLKFDESWRSRNIILDGYWQSEKYFKDIRNEVIKAFGFPWSPRVGYVSVHVRRGDYLKLIKKHPPVGYDWITKAMNLFKGSEFIFFSDDIQWCKDKFGHREDCQFSHGTPEYDLVQMSCCEHHICSASTFAWWGAWLNQNPTKRVVMPREWFVQGYQGLITRDIVPSEWLRL